MKIKLSATAVWIVNPHDEEMARELLKEQPKNVILDNLQSALHRDPEVGYPTITAEELVDIPAEKERCTCGHPAVYHDRDGSCCGNPDNFKATDLRGISDCPCRKYVAEED